ncbi:MAG: metallophosphoesterase [Bacilli bacterium]
MTEKNKILLDLIKQDYTIFAISNKMHLTYKQIFNRVNSIEKEGYLIGRKYDTNGNIIYSYNANYTKSKKKEKVLLYNNKDIIKILTISDLHLGNIKASEESINIVYDYCVKNGINIILNCGDILDGTYSRTEQIIPPEEQIAYLLDMYPIEKNIINLYLLGDHDYSLKNKAMSLSKALNSKRHDFVNLINGASLESSGNIEFSYNNIKVDHYPPQKEESTIEDCQLHLVGHKHSNKAIYNLKTDMTPTIYVPSLSRISPEGEICIPRALELTLYLDKKHHLQVIDKKDLLILNNKIIITNEELINYSKEDINFNSKVKKKTL